MKVKGMRKVAKLGTSLKGLAGSLLSLRTGMIAAAGIAGLGYLIKQSMDATDNLGKMSEVIGLSVQNLSRLRHAASIGGMESSKLDKAMQKLAVNLADVAGGTGEAMDEFIKYGISAKNVDGSMRDVMDVLADVADVTQELGSTTERTDLMYKLFGARGGLMVNILKDGSAAMHDLMGEADQLGLVMSRSTVAGVESANDAITRLSSFVATSFHQAVAKIAPAIQVITDNIREWAEQKVMQGGGLDKVVKEVASAIVMGAVEILKAFDAIGNGLITFTEILRDLTPGVSRSMSKIAFEISEVEKAIQMQSLDEGFLSNVWKQLTTSQEELRKELAALNSEYEYASKTQTHFRFNSSKLQQTLLASLNPINKAKDAVGELNNELGNGGTVTSAWAETWSEMKNGFESYAKTAKTGTVTIAKITKNAMSTLETGLTDMLMGVKGSFKDMIKGLIRSLIQLQVKMAIIGVMKSVFGLNLPGFANGGRPPVGKASIVGERGAELFVPDRAGTIIPNHQLNTATGEVRNVHAEITFNVNAIDSNSFHSYLISSKSTIEGIINQSISGNGSVRRTIKQTV
jgi:hypothetical protein